jgi:hypothetical protein
MGSEVVRRRRSIQNAEQVTAVHRIALKLSDGAGERECVGMFEEQEQHALSLFVADVGRLCECALVKKAFDYKVKLEVRGGVQTVTCGDLPRDEELEHLVFRMRKFLLQEEPVSFLKVLSTVARRCEDAALRDGLRKVKEQFMKLPFSIRIKDSDGTTDLTSSDGVLVWLNAGLLHHDDRKKALLRRIWKQFPEKACRSAFGMMLNELARAIINLGNLIQAILGKQEYFNLGGLRVQVAP